MLSKLPSGLLGVVLASLLAAFMSTISSHLNWGASYISIDFYKRFIYSEASEKKVVLVGRISTVFLMILAGFVALELNDALKVLSTFDEGPDLVLFYKYLLKLKGEDEYNFHFNESDKLSESQSIFAKKQFKLFNEWWQAWNQII